MKKIVVKVGIEDEKAKRKALTLVAGLEGVDTVAADIKEKKITIIGSADPVDVTYKLRRLGYTELLSVGTAKEEKKKENEEYQKEGKKPDTKKETKHPASSLRRMVIKLVIEDEKVKRKALMLVARIEGVDSVAADLKEKKITIIGSADPVDVTNKLRRLGYSELLSVGPAKEEKKEEKEDDQKEGKKTDTKIETKHTASSLRKMVIKLAIEDEKAKRKALLVVAEIEGVDSVTADLKEKKITIIGSADPVVATAKLRKLGYTELLSVGPAKEEKKEEKKICPEFPTVHIPWPDQYSLPGQYPQPYPPGFSPGIEFDSICSRAVEQLEKPNKQLTDGTHVWQPLGPSEGGLIIRKIMVRPWSWSQDQKAKSKALELVQGLEGVDSVEADIKEKILIIIGSVDPRDVTAGLLSVDTVKEEKKEEKDDKNKGKKLDAKKKTKPEVRTGWLTEAAAEQLELEKNILRQSTTRQDQSPSHLLDFQPVGIEEQVEDVKALLDMEGAQSALAVIVCGFGGLGKSTLAASVVQSLDWSSTDFKFCLVQIDKKTPNRTSHIIQVQKYIISKLGGVKLDFQNPSEGQRKIKEVIQQKCTLLFIDNVVDKDYIKDLLPRDLQSGEQETKLRMIITSRDKNVKAELNITCKEYEMKGLSDAASKSLLLETILQSQVVKDITLDEERMIDEVAAACRGVPLLLSVFGKHLRMERDEDSYKEALDVLRKGDLDSYSDEDLDRKLMFVYNKNKELSHITTDRPEWKKWVESNDERDKWLDAPKVHSIKGLQLGEDGKEVDCRDKAVKASRKGINPPRLLDFKPVGIEEQVEEVKKLLDMKGAHSALAVIVYGFGGLGKTTLVDSVVQSLDWSSTDFRFCKVAIDQKTTDKTSHIIKLQKNVLYDLEGVKPCLRDPHDGLVKIKEALEKKCSLLFIDNVVDKDYIQYLLPKNLSSGDQKTKLRIIITSREKNVKVELNPDIMCKEYEVKGLSDAASRRLLLEAIRGNGL